MLHLSVFSLASLNVSLTLNCAISHGQYYMQILQGAILMSFKINL